MFFSTGITLDTEELVLVTSRSPRYYVSAAYWDRDSLLWSFPAILDADPERAKEMLSYVFGRQRRNFGIHSRYIDGTVLEPGFELDELVAPLQALERYINKTGEKSILNDSDIVQGISLILNRLRQHEAASCRLYDTFLQPTDDEHVYPYITYDNVLVWKALKDLAQLAPQYAHLEKTASEIKDAIMTHCVQKDAAGKPYFGWSIDLNGSHDVYDEPPGSLQLLPLFDFCSPTDEIYRNTVAMIRSPEYEYLDATGDESFYLQAMEVYIETARFWYSRCIIHPDGSADLMFCKGPDEYCGITNNNLFTNCMVKFNLDLAIKAALKIKETDPNRYSKLSLSDEEVLAWHSLRDNLKECRDPQTGRYLPDETFTRLEPVDIKTLKTDDGASYHHVCFDRLQRYQVIKQADTLLLMSRLPKKFTLEERLNAWEDFEPCCLHDSTLSFASHALFAAQNGLQEAAEKYFKKALYLDLHEIMNNTGKEGLHLACLGETWSSIFFGFLGANFNGDTPAFSPVLPTGWKALRMNFYWQGRIYHLAVSDNHYIVTIA